MSDWRDFGLRGMPPLSGRTKVTPPPPLVPLIEACQAAANEPFVGLTFDGSITPGVFQRRGAGASTAHITEAAQGLLGSLSAEQRAMVSFPLDATERRTWFNIHPYVFRHGLVLESLTQQQREAALSIVSATLSSRGYQQARDIMRLNGLLIEITKSPDEYGEWPYWFSIFGTPSSSEPWAWQIDGHHLNLNCTVFPDRIVLTPSFMGSEPCHVYDGPLAGTEVFVPEERAGLELIRSLTDAQQAQAILYQSLDPADLPAHLNNFIDGRMQGAAFKDNAVLAPQGVRATDLNDTQRRLLRNVIATYIGWGNDEQTDVTMRDADAHLDSTHFSWMGTRSESGPFYYRVHSEVIFIEFDHHPGIVFNNTVPTRNHIHTILRTPNGGDYGADLLRQHYAEFDHSHGKHEPHSGHHDH